MSEKHIIKEGSRKHVISYHLQDGKGIERCSEPNCEINNTQDSSLVESDYYKKLAEGLESLELHKLKSLLAEVKAGLQFYADGDHYEIENIDSYVVCVCKERGNKAKNLLERMG